MIDIAALKESIERGEVARDVWITRKKKKNKRLMNVGGRESLLF